MLQMMCSASLKPLPCLLGGTKNLSLCEVSRAKNDKPQKERTSLEREETVVFLNRNLVVVQNV